MISIELIILWFFVSVVGIINTVYINRTKQLEIDVKNIKRCYCDKYIIELLKEKIIELENEMEDLRHTAKKNQNDVSLITFQQSDFYRKKCDEYNKKEDKKEDKIARKEDNHGLY